VAKEFSLADFGIVKADTLKEPHSITIYGPPGKGKSVFAASISEVEGYERVLVLDTEAGAVSLGSWYPNVDVLPCPTAARFAQAVEALVSGKLIHAESGLPYQAVIVDTLDKAQSRQIEVFDKAPEGFTNGKKNERYKWGAIKLWMEKLTDMLHQAPFLTIFVVHAEDHTNENTGTTTTTVMLGGASRDNFPSVSDAVGYFNVTKVKGPSDDKPEEHRTVDFTVKSKFVTKQRFADRLNGVFLDPNMATIFSKIRA
jgi:hypothetical protein